MPLSYDFRCDSDAIVDNFWFGSPRCSRFFVEGVRRLKGTRLMYHGIHICKCSGCDGTIFQNRSTSMICRKQMHQTMQWSQHQPMSQHPSPSHLDVFVVCSTHQSLTALTWKPCHNTPLPPHPMWLWCDSFLHTTPLQYQSLTNVTAPPPDPNWKVWKRIPTQFFCNTLHSTMSRAQHLGRLGSRNRGQKHTRPIENVMCFAPRFRAPT